MCTGEAGADDEAGECLAGCMAASVPNLGQEVAVTAAIYSWDQTLEALQSSGA
jgi:hypothetical protein